MGDKNVISLLLIWDAIPFDLFFLPFQIKEYSMLPNLYRSFGTINYLSTKLFSITTKYNLVIIQVSNYFLLVCR